VRIFLKALFGIKETFGGKSGSSKKSLAGTSASVAANTGSTANNLKKAAKHAKDLRRTMMGIDELSRLAEKATAAAASGGSGGGGGTSAPAVSVGDPGTFDGIISDETSQKIADFEKKIESIKDKLNGAYLVLKGITEIVFGNPIQGFKDLGEGIKKLLPNIDRLKQRWDDLSEKIADKVLKAKATLTDGVSSAAQKAKAAWGSAKTAIANKVASAKAQLQDGMSSVWKNNISPVWEKAKKVSGTVSATVKLKLKNKFSKAWDKVKKVWNAIGDKTATITLSFKDLLKTGYNAIAKAIQKARNASGAVGKAAKAILPDLKPLAKGGILTEPTAALMGEYPGARSNPEIATPQSLMYETIQRANGDLVTAFATMTRQVIAAIEDKDLNVSIGDEQIARSAQRGNSAYRNRTGKALITT
jgi:hypothetical protein